MECKQNRFLIRPMQKEDIEEVARLFAEAFTEREPINIHLKIDKETFYSVIAKYAAEDCAEENLSFVCVDTSLPGNGQIIAYRLSQTFKMKAAPLPPLVQRNGFNDWNALKTLFNSLKIAWFQRHFHCAVSCCYFFSLGVKRQYENQGIASKLIDYSLDYVKAKGFEYVYVIASAATAQHLFTKKYNFTEVMSVDFDNFEYRGNYYLKGITCPPKVIGYEYDLNKWNAEHPTANRF